ncbi:MAG: hypothetical protein R2739_11235 [Chitinophagales bacterium]
MKKKLGLLLLTFSVLVACQKENTDKSDAYAENGSAFVVNEGGFTKNNGSISYISPTNEVSNNIFESSNNGQVLGDIVQSFTKVGNLGIICVNNSQKVSIVDVRTFKHLAEVTTGTDYPRFALGINNNKAYITNGSFTGTVLVLNLNTFNIDKTISVGNGPEEMIASNGKVLVANSGGFGTANTISVINTSTDAVSNTITVGDNPTEFVRDAQGYIWVLCKGYVTYPAPTYTPDRQSAAKLVRINPALESVDREIELLPVTADFSSVDNLAATGDGSTLYVCVDNHVYSINYTATTLPATPIINSYFYGLEVHPYTDNIWALDAGNFNEAGKIIRYNSNATAIDTLKVGIIPNSVYFNM